MTSNRVFHRILKRNYKCSTDRLFAYFVGLIGLSGMVYTYLQSNVISLKNPDIIFVDREIEKGGRYAVLLKQTIDKVSIPNSDTFPLAHKSLNIDSINSSINRIPNNDKFVELPSGDVVLNQSSIYRFVINETELKHMFRNDRRTVILKKCNKLFEGDANAYIDTLIYMKSHLRKSMDSSRYNKITTNCSTFKLGRGYLDSPITQVERDFPLAYSIIAYKDIEQIERLLRAIYRPQNFYCVHLDRKTTIDDVTTMTSIADCFPNVFMSSRSVDVQWGKFSVLEAELVCMKDLLTKKGWKYFINLTGQEFPLKTNLEIVKILEVLKGANLVDGTWVRARKNYFYRWTKSGKSPPHKIRPIKGSVHVCVNRDFVDFAINDYRSKDFLEWLKDTEIPDETFFASLNHNPHLNIPGSFLGEPEEYPQKPTFTRYKNWEVGHGVWVRKCSGKYVRNICILGGGDLHRLNNDISLFANKFHLDFEYMAYDCMEAMIHDRTKDQYFNQRTVDVSFYAMLDQVKLRLVKSDIGRRQRQGRQLL